MSSRTMAAPKGVTLPTNPKYVDLLTEDKPINGQKWGCFSFVSPERILKQKEMFYFEEFVKQWPLTKAMDKFTKFISFISYKHHLNFEKVMEDLQEFTKQEQKELFGDFTIEDEYKTYMDKNEERLESLFDEQNQFQTSVRGIKFRGAYETQKEAEMRAELLREAEGGAHEIHVGPVGMWLPFHPEAYKTGRVEYLEPELNQLMHEKERNEKQAKDAFDARVKASKEKAIKENEEKAAESGNVLTQTLDQDGNLISVDGTSSIEAVLAGNGDEVSSADIRSELFEGDNIVTKRKD